MNNDSQLKLEVIAAKYGDLQLKYWTSPNHVDWTVELVGVADNGTLSEYELIGSGSTIIEAIDDAYTNYYLYGVLLMVEVDCLASITRAYQQYLQANFSDTCELYWQFYMAMRARIGVEF